MQLTKIKPSKLAMAIGLSVATLVAATAQASSHREAPFITKYPQVDGTDFYMFNSYEPDRQDFVTILANYVPVQAAYGGPTYFPLDENALYEIHIDNDGDAIEDLTYQFRVDSFVPGGAPVMQTVGPEGNQRTIPAVLRNVAPVSFGSKPGLSYDERFTLTVVEGNRRTGTRTSITNADSGSATFGKPFDYSGTKTFGGAGQYSVYADQFIWNIDLPGCEKDGKVFVGQRLDPFKLALGEIFDLVNLSPVATDDPEINNPNRNALLRNNITTFALELPKECITGDNNGVIGAWTTASLRQATVLNADPSIDKREVVGGAWTQVSRLGNFLVNELFIGITDKDKFNASHPKDDVENFADYVTHPGFPEIVDALFGPAVAPDAETIAPTNFPRNDIVTGFLTGVPTVNQLANVNPSEMLRLNTSNTFIVSRAEQHSLGALGGDLAGFPNGRRPGDDSVDIALRVAMGALCHPLPIGEGFNLGLCTPEDAIIGNAPLSDNVPISAMDFENKFPYLITPYPGSPANAPVPQPRDL